MSRASAKLSDGADAKAASSAASAVTRAPRTSRTASRGSARVLPSRAKTVSCSSLPPNARSSSSTRGANNAAGSGPCNLLCDKSRRCNDAGSTPIDAVCISLWLTSRWRSMRSAPFEKSEACQSVFSRLWLTFNDVRGSVRRHVGSCVSALWASDKTLKRPSVPSAGGRDARRFFCNSRRESARNVPMR